MRGVCLFGAHHPGYPRSTVILEGLRRLGVPVVPCTAPPKRKSPRRYPSLAMKYRGLRAPFDVLWVPEFAHKDVPLAWMLARASGKALLFDPLVSRFDTRVRDRGDAAEHGLQAWHNRNLDRVSMSLPDVLLADTRAHAEYYARRAAAPGTRIRVVEVGYDDRMFAPAAPAEGDGAVRVLFYGSYLPLHGVDVIVEAAERLRGEPRIHFDLVGGGQTFDAVRERVRAAGLSRVRLTARVPAHELPDRIAAATLCLGIFGRTEKAARVVPNKIYQCMAVGRAVITAGTPAVREILRDDREVVTVPPGDGEALAAAIRGLCFDRDRRERIAAAGGDLVRREYSPEPVARRFLAACGEAMER